MRDPSNNPDAPASWADDSATISCNPDARTYTVTWHLVADQTRVPDVLVTVETDDGQESMSNRVMSADFPDCVIPGPSTQAPSVSAATCDADGTTMAYEIAPPLDC